MPRHAVIEHLNHIGSRPLRIYLEHVINELGESGPECHERLAELYLEATQKADATGSGLSFQNDDWYTYTSLQTFQMTRTIV